MQRRELLIGCGNDRHKMIAVDGVLEWNGLVTLDHKADCGADIIHDLDVLPYPFEDNSLDEIHAYDVLEHCGRQGDWRYFFAQWEEFARILKPGGVFVGICPKHTSVWAWGDPSHTRVITPPTLKFLDQDQYKALVGKSSMSDFRSVYSADIKLAHLADYDEDRFYFVLKVIK